jgi:hypothetical protein
VLLRDSEGSAYPVWQSWVSHEGEPWLFAEIRLEENGPTGLELAQKAVAIRPKLKVLYTTGADVTDGTKALFVEGSAFLGKPYTPAQLVAAVGALLPN